MGRLLGKGKLTNEDKVADEYNECAAEVKKEHPFIGQGALHQEVMKRLAQRKAAEQDANQTTNQKDGFTPQRIVPFRRRPRSNSTPNKDGSSPNQSLSRSFIGFLSSSASSYNTMKTSNMSSVTDFHESNKNNIVIAGRRTTVNEDDGVHTTMYAMRDIELSDGDDLSSDIRSSKSSRSSLGSKLSSLKGIESLEENKQIDHSTQIRRSSSHSSISTLQQCSSDVSKEEAIVENSTDPKTSEDEEPPQHIDNGLKEEQEVMEFVEEFLARGGSLKPKGEKIKSRVNQRRSSLLSVEENKELINSGGSVTKSIATLEGNSVTMADGSLICGWGKESFNESELMAGDLICNWDSRRSVLSNSSASSRLAVAPNSGKLPSEIDVGNNMRDKS